ncbi:Glycerol kinase [Rhizopus stolonifer]|uniref:glycerol kinase n=1 Tax=Rhizopus stolonifer TaxID=4846 RepID=A0A367KN77_RHIST|nr:Glycerol kinase [Rhizopus stolonifer]
MTNNQFIGSIDQGTTSTRFVIFNRDGKVITYHKMEFKQHYLHPGWVEHDPYDILDSIEICISQALRKLSILGYENSTISCIGITNQRETTIAWDSETGEPLCPAIVWSDGRTTRTVKKLMTQKHIPKEKRNADVLRHICGLPLATYFSAVKLRWMLDNISEVQEAHDQNRLQFGTVDTWIIYNLTGGVQNNGLIITDKTNACRTMLMDINTHEWSDEAIRFFGFEKVKLAKIVPSSGVYGKIHAGPLKNIPIAGCLGDQQSALVGQKCFNIGDAKNTYGTGCFMLYNTGETLATSHNGLLTTVAYQFGNSKAVYAIEGSIAVAGSSVLWLRDNMEVIDKCSDIGKLASKVQDTSGVYFVTAFTGLFAPYWRNDARGTICGLTQFTQREHIARATLEAVCYQSRAILEAMNRDTENPLRSLKVDGGMSDSDECMQIQSDVLNIEVVRPEMRETTALGAAIAAGLATGIWESLDSLNDVNVEGQSIFKPRISNEEKNRMYAGWKEAIVRSLGWANTISDLTCSEED